MGLIDLRQCHPDDQGGRQNGHDNGNDTDRHAARSGTDACQESSNDQEQSDGRESNDSGQKVARGRPVKQHEE